MDKSRYITQNNEINCYSQVVQFYSRFVIFVYFYLSFIGRYANLFLQKYNILIGEIAVNQNAQFQRLLTTTNTPKPNFGQLLRKASSFKSKCKPWSLYWKIIILISRLSSSSKMKHIRQIVYCRLFLNYIKIKNKVSFPNNKQIISGFLFK